MKSMIMENGVTFKELEKNIFAWICQIGRCFTKEFLERYDRMLMESRDKKKYRNKGTRQTTVKTVYGEVTYQRTVYEVIEEDGTRHFVYLLDETLELTNVGLISTNMAELLVKVLIDILFDDPLVKLNSAIIDYNHCQWQGLRRHKCPIDNDFVYEAKQSSRA